MPISYFAKLALLATLLYSYRPGLPTQEQSTGLYSRRRSRKRRSNYNRLMLKLLLAIPKPLLLRALKSRKYKGLSSLSRTILVGMQKLKRITQLLGSNTYSGPSNLLACQLKLLPQACNSQSSAQLGISY